MAKNSGKKGSWDEIQAIFNEINSRFQQSNQTVTADCLFDCMYILHKHKLSSVCSLYIECSDIITHFSKKRKKLSSCTVRIQLQNNILSLFGIIDKSISCLFTCKGCNAPTSTNFFGTNVTLTIAISASKSH